MPRSGTDSGRLAGKHRPMRTLPAVLLAAAFASACAAPGGASRAVREGRRDLLAAAAPAPGLALPGERHLRNVRQLTFGGENAEAYFASTGKELVFQATPEGAGCDQQYVMRADGSGVRRVSTGQGRRHLRLLLPGRRADPLRVDARGRAPACPPQPDLLAGLRLGALRLPALHRAAGRERRRARSRRRPGRTTPRRRSRADGWIVFTSTRDGDLELYKMRLDGSGAHAAHAARPATTAARSSPPTASGSSTARAGRRRARRSSTTTGRCSRGSSSARASSRSAR